MSPKDIHLTVESMASRVHFLLAHELQDRSFVVGMVEGGVRDHVAIANYSAALASLSGMEPGPLENTVTGVEPEPVDPMRTACLAVDAVIATWRKDDRGFRSWWANSGCRGYAHDEAAHAVRDALAADGGPAPDPGDLGKPEPAADLGRLFDGHDAGECQEMQAVAQGRSASRTVDHAAVDAMLDGAPDEWWPSEERPTPADVLGLRDSLTKSRSRVEKLEGDLRGLEGQRDRLQWRNDNQSDLIADLRAQLAVQSEEPKRLVPRRVVGKTLGEVIREQRIDAGLSQEWLASQAAYPSTAGEFAEIEDGTRDVSAMDLALLFGAIAKAKRE